MKINKLHFTAVQKQGFFYFLTIVLVTMYFFLVVFNSLQTTTIDIEFTAEKSGILRVFWPRPENTYDDTQQIPIKYTAGLNKHQITIPYFSSTLNLRLDPDEKKSKFLLHRLSLTRSGVKTELNPERIADTIFAVSAVKWTVTADSLDMTLETNDPMIIFKSIPFPVSTGFWLLPLLAFIILASLFRGLNKSSSAWSGYFTVLIFVSLAILYWLHRSSPQEDQYLALFINALPLMAIVLAVNYIEGGNGTEISFKSSFSLLIIVTFILFMIGQLYLSLTPEVLRTIKSKTVYVYSDNKDKGLNSALKLARDELESSFVKSLRLKGKLIILNAESKIFVLGFSHSKKVILGKDNWFFEGYGERRVEKDIVQSLDNITDYMGQNPFTEEELEAWRITLEERYYWLKEKGSKYIFVLAPTKALVYPEKLPERILGMKNKHRRPTRYDQLIDYLNERSIVPVVDLRKALLEEKENYPDVPLFYRTDFHWNYFGSFLAYRAIINGINKAYPDLQLEAGVLEEFSVQKKTDWVHTGFVKMIGLDPLRHKNETYFTFHPNAESNYFSISEFSTKGINDYSTPKNRNKVFGQSIFRVREIKNPDGKLPLMYIIGDSFIEKTLGFFSLHSKETLFFRVVVNIPEVPFAEGVTTPDVVVQELLNMYLLRKPPSNNRQIKNARIRALEKNKVTGSFLQKSSGGNE